MRQFQLAVATVACVLLAGCSKPAGESSDSGSAVSTPAATPNDAEKQALLAALPAPYNTGDLMNGQSKFALCRSCHTITEGDPT